MNPTVYLYALLLLLLTNAGSAITGYYKGNTAGFAKANALFAVESKQRSDQSITLLKQNLVTYEKTIKEQREAAVTNAKQHALRVDAINRTLADTRASIRVAGGLRFTSDRTICNNNNMPTFTGSAIKYNDTFTNTIPLPDKITNDLLDSAAEADSITEIARACQNWITSQGMYGSAK